MRLLGKEEEGEELGSRNSTAAVWQRPILMGEKCEMLKYSGLILYDERGRLLQDQIAAMENGYKVLIRKFFGRFEHTQTSFKIFFNNSKLLFQL